jgi:hypothetical protein
MKYDLIIPVAQKDYVKIPFCIERCKKFLNPQPENIYVVAKNLIKIEGVTFIQEESVFPFGPKDIKYRRPHWIYQQVIKLCQNFTKNDYYMCVDSDLFFNKPIDVFVDDKPVYYHTIAQHHEPYFNFMRLVFDLDKQVDHTFIADFTMFNKAVCKEIIPDVYKFLLTLNEVLHDGCLIGEPEIYGNYLAKKYPGSYKTGNLKVYMEGKFMPELYTSEEIRSKLDGREEDLVILHSWT